MELMACNFVPAFLVGGMCFFISLTGVTGEKCAWGSGGHYREGEEGEELVEHAVCD